MQFPVHPEPDLDIIFLRAQMDIRGTFPDCLGQNGIHQLDDRRVFGHMLKIGFRQCFGSVSIIRFLIQISDILHLLHDTVFAGIGPINGGYQIIEICSVQITVSTSRSVITSI